MHRTVAALATEGHAIGGPDCAVLVASRAGGAQLRSTLENILLLRRPAATAVMLPLLLTRDQWYAEMHARLGSTQAWLSELERTVLFQRAAREACASGLQPPFRLGPGLVGEMLTLYDGLRRHLRTVDTFERLLVGELEPSRDVDRGAERLLRQTHFLVAVFRRYEEILASIGALDEERLRARLLDERARTLLGRVILTTPDVVFDPASGLWPADFDLLTRLHGLKRIDVVATDAVLEAGLRERLDVLLPGMEDAPSPAVEQARPTLLHPSTDPERRYVVARDREDELIDFARRLKARAGRGDGSTPVSDRVALVFQRPLPYVYLARTVFEGARIPYQVVDALPLAAEPFAAVVDLVFEAVETGFARRPVVGLLASRLVRFVVDGERVTRSDAFALDRMLRQHRESGGRASLERLRESLDGRGRAPGTRVALAAGLDLVTALEPLAEPAPASSLLERLLEFFQDASSPMLSAADDLEPDRHLRARAAILGAMTRLRDAYRSYGDVECTCTDVAAQVRRWVEAQTFAPRRGSGGVQLTDVRAARYGDFDEIRIVGLTEDDWPERPRRSIFYPPALLSELGWPADADRLHSARADLQDLLHLPVHAVSLSTFSLDGDRLVGPSPLVESLAEGDLPLAEDEANGPTRILADEALSMSPVVPEAVDGLARAWLDVRLAGPSRDMPAYRGMTLPKPRASYSVTSVEQYLGCPFQYFSRRVLGLEEEPSDDPQITPLARGRFIHDVFGRFFTSWQAAGHRAITPGNLDLARAELTRVVEQCVSTLPGPDRRVERSRMLGSAAATGLGERVLRLELERPGVIVERLVEYELDGEWLIRGGEEGSERRIRIRGTADRIDLTADGRLWVLDYKSGQAPARNRAVQLPIYAVCAEQRLRGYGGTNWTVGGGAYVPLGGRQPTVSMVRRPADVGNALRDGQARFLDAVDGVEAGRFPPRPADSTLCDLCAYEPVCRKEFAADG